MAHCKDDGQPLLDSLRRYVRVPPAETLTNLQRELDEAERRAFRRFSERVAAIETTSTPGAGPTTAVTTSHGDTRPKDELHQAYRETVMDVAHYDAVYGESLEINIAAEFPEEITVGLLDDTIPFTEMVKARVMAAVETTVAQCEAYCDALEGEQASVATAEEDLTAISDSLDGPRIPDWHSSAFEERLAAVAQRRQETLRSRTQPAHMDGHDFCTALYSDQEWAYPVLTAVARLREVVDVRQSDRSTA